MKKIMLATLAGLFAAAILHFATSCDKVENGGRLTELWVLIAEGELLVPSHYTASSWAPFSAALDNAKSVAAGTAPTLAIIENAITELRKAMHELVNMEKAGENLATAIAVAEAWSNDGYTTASWSAFQNALTAAKGVNSNAASTIDQLDVALQNLQKAFEALAKA
jgi:Xaa-Pro aminopeptidase